MTAEIIEVDYYEPQKDKGGKVVPGTKPRTSYLYNELRRIIDPTDNYKGLVETVRACTTKDERDRLKIQLLPAITFSCTCEGHRDQNKVRSRTGVIVIDIDAKENNHIQDWSAVKAKLANLDHTICVALSVSGNGVAWWVRYDPACDHLGVFVSLEKDLKDIGLQADPSCKDITRLRFVTYDPDATVKFSWSDIANYQPREVLKKEQAIKPTATVCEDDTIRYLAELEKREVDITEGYNNWIEVGFAFASLGEGGRELFHRVSRFNSGYDYDDCNKKFDELLSKYDSTKEDRITISTFHFKCRTAGIEIPAIEIPLTENNSDDIFAKYDHLRISGESEIPEPEAILKINNECISTPGNLTSISGASKQGKSAGTGFILAGALAQGKYDGLEGVEVKYSFGKAVLHFDTEQSRPKHLKNLKGILRRAGLERTPANFLSYNIRGLDLKDYQTVTTEIFSAAFQKFGGIHLVVIDGIADYINDPNDQETSNAIVKYFEQLAVKYNTPIITIIHVNPGGDKERGHLGSQLQRKSESVLTVKKDEDADVSYIEPKFLRNAGPSNIPLIQFKYDPDKGYHTYYGVKGSPNNKDAKVVGVAKEIAGKVFGVGKALTYNEAIERIMQVAVIKERAAKERFKEMRVHGFTTQGQDRLWRGVF